MKSLNRVRKSLLMITFNSSIFPFIKTFDFLFCWFVYFYSQRFQSEPTTVLGYMEYMLIRPVALVIGSAGTVLLPSNNVHSLCSIMMFFTLVIGPTMFLIAKNTVSFIAFLFIIVSKRILRKYVALIDLKLIICECEMKTYSAVI